MFNLPMKRARFQWFAMVVATTAGPIGAQAAQPATSVSSQIGVSRQFETRQQLEAQATAAESQKRTSEAFLLRSRLQRGDFQEGDRIAVVIEGSQMVLDTLQVRTGKMLQFPRMGELTLNGVLRAELTDVVRQHLAKYLNSPNVRTTPLLQIGVFGNVTQPGYHYTPADVVLRDVIMRAGGPTATADLSKVVVRRGGEVIWGAKDVSVALSDGLSVDGLHLRTGDELWVPERKRFQFSTLATIISTTMALTLAIVQMTR